MTVRTHPKYLFFHVDKHQHHPWFDDVIHDHVRKDADDGLTVIVDIAARKKYVNGKWWDID